MKRCVHAFHTVTPLELDMSGKQECVSVCTGMEPDAVSLQNILGCGYWFSNKRVDHACT